VTEAHPAALMRDALRVAGERPLLLMRGGRSRTGHELEARIGSLAAELAAQGLRGRRIGLWHENSFATVEAHLAIEWIAATRVPVDPGAAASEAAAVFKAAGADAVITDAGRARAIPGDVLVYDDRHPITDRVGIDPIAADPDTVLHLFPRSVEHGELRGVPVSYGNWQARLDANERLYRTGAYGPPLAEDDCFLTAQQVMHGTSMVGTFPFLRLGLPQVVLERFDANAALDAIDEHRVTSTFFVPAMVTRLVSALETPRGSDLPLRRLLYGGAPFPREELLDATRVLGDRLIQLYGHWAGAWPISVLDGKDHLRILQGDSRIGTSCGCPVTDVEVQLRPLPDSSPGEGELSVRGPSVVRDYADPDGWYGLGDRAALDDHGYLYLRGRIDGLINTGAYHVYPREIEEALMSLAPVRAARVSGEPDPKWGQAVIAHVVAQAGENPDVEELRRLLRERLAPYKVPKRIHFVEAI
jgi:acyl-CoA synthetase (AMP-forming)/AMP-acid ligase II